MKRCKGKSVAIVARAGSLLTSGQGEAIDAHDLVIRVNYTLPLDPEQAEHIGTRTDLLYHCQKVCEGPRLSAEALGVPTVRVPSKLRRRLPKERGFNELAYRPNTGTVAVFHALKEKAKRVSVFGMDFYGSGHVGQPMPDPSSPVAVWAHNPENDRIMLRAAYQEGRIWCDPILTRALA